MDVHLKLHDLRSDKLSVADRATAVLRTKLQCIALTECQEPSPELLRRRAWARAFPESQSDDDKQLLEQLERQHRGLLAVNTASAG